MEFAVMIALITEISQKYGVDSELLQAIIAVESAYEPYRARYEPNYKYVKTPDVYASALYITPDTEAVFQKLSFGLTQVMGGLARELGYTDHLTKLFDPRTNLEYSCKYLAILQSKYGGNEDKIIAAYNAGSAKVLPSGKFANQPYVDKVKNNLKLLRQLK